MSTKADITIEGEKRYYIYKRTDGYPEGVIPVIVPLVKEYYSKNRRKSLLDFISKKLYIKLTDEKYKNGFGLHDIIQDGGRDPWREYSYHIYKNGDIQVYNRINEYIVKTIHTIGADCNGQEIRS